MPINYTPTEKRLIKILEDGRPHPITQLAEVLQSAEKPDVLRVHIHKLIKKLPVGYDIAQVRRMSVSQYVLIKYPPKGLPILDDSR